MPVHKRRRAALGLLAALIAVAVGCALGDEDVPGCHADGDCGGGFTCRAGACFREVLPDGGPDAG